MVSGMATSTAPATALSVPHQCLRVRGALDETDVTGMGDLLVNPNRPIQDICCRSQQSLTYDTPKV
jgi:hypothetical protein